MRSPQNRSRTSTQAISVPITTLIRGDEERLSHGQLDRGPGLRVRERVDVPLPPVLAGRRPRWRPAGSGRAG